jgi:hypothetical protein
MREGHLGGLCERNIISQHWRTVPALSQKDVPQLHEQNSLGNQHLWEHLSSDHFFIVKVLVLASRTLATFSIIGLLGLSVCRSSATLKNKPSTWSFASFASCRRRWERITYVQRDSLASKSVHFLALCYIF